MGSCVSTSKGRPSSRSARVVAADTQALDRRASPDSLDSALGEEVADDDGLFPPGPRASYSGTGAGRLTTLHHSSGNVSNAIDGIVVQTPSSLSPPVLPAVGATHPDTTSPWTSPASAATAGGGGTIREEDDGEHEEERRGGHTAVTVGGTRLTNKLATQGHAPVQRSMSYEEYRLQMEGSVSRSTSAASDAPAPASNVVFLATHDADATKLSKSGRLKTKSVVVGTPAGSVPLSMPEQSTIATAESGPSSASVTQTSVFEQAFEAKLKSGAYAIGHVSTGGVTPLDGPGMVGGSKLSSKVRLQCLWGEPVLLTSIDKALRCDCLHTFLCGWPALACIQ